VQAKRVDRQHVNRKTDTFDGARGGVVVPVTAERRDLPFGEKLKCRRMQASPGPGRVPRSELVPATAMTDPDEQQIALADMDVLCRLSCGQVVLLQALRPRFRCGQALADHPVRMIPDAN